MASFTAPHRTIPPPRTILTLAITAITLRTVLVRPLSPPPLTRRPGARLLVPRPPLGAGVVTSSGCDVLIASATTTTALALRLCDELVQPLVICTTHHREG